MITVSHLQVVVVATTVLIALRQIASHEMDLSESSLDDAVFQNWTATIFALNGSAISESAKIAPNGTLVLPLAENPGKPTKSFHFNVLPKGLFIYALLVPLQHYWNLVLERRLPARSRPRQMVEKATPAVGEGETDGRYEQQVIDKWIANGKVKRSSLSVCNTFAKWVLDLTVGKIIYEIVYHVADALLLDHDFGRIKHQLFEIAPACFGMSFVGIGPLVSLAGFVIVPARYRVVFRAAGDLSQTVFFAIFLMIIVPWAIRTRFAQEIMANATRVAWEGYGKNGVGLERLSDEL